MTDLPLLRYEARIGRPMLASTGGQHWPTSPRLLSEGAR
jgi:hypothetical protein